MALICESFCLLWLRYGIGEAVGVQAIVQKNNRRERVHFIKEMLNFIYCCWYFGFRSSGAMN